MKKQEQFLLKGPRMFLLICAVAACMVATGIRVLVGLFPMEEITPWDIFGVCFISVWLLVILWMAFFSLVAGSKRMRFDESGVCYSSLFSKKMIPWEKIRDYGFSNSGSVRGGGQVYCLYFSRQVCPTKRGGKKKLSGDTVKMFVVSSERGYECLTENILPFCRLHIEVEPFHSFI